ncbi:MAG: M13 family metallopeptidase [Vulcanimicrobiota bacterium]
MNISALTTSPLLSRPACRHHGPLGHGHPVHRQPEDQFTFSGPLLSVTPPPAPAPALVAPAAPLEELQVEETRPPFSRDNLDPTTSPTRDFYQFAMGGYLASHPIPPDRSRFGIDAEVTVGNEKVVKAILEELSSSPQTPGSNEQKLGDFYAAGMNEAAIQAAGLSALESDFARIAAIKNVADIQQAATAMHAEGNSVYFSFYAAQDAKDSSRMIGEFSQGGLSLPNRDYYVKDDESSKETVKAFRQHVTRMFELAGDSPAVADRQAAAVLRLETTIAKASLSNAEMRDPATLYHPTTQTELDKLVPCLSFPAYFHDLKVQAPDWVNVAVPKYFERLDDILAETPIEEHKAYLRWHTLSAAAPYLSKEFADENFNFFGKTMRGLEQQPPRAKQIADKTDEYLGEALGVKFVERRFSPEAKAKMEDMVRIFGDTLRDKIRSLEWMGPETKQEALAKVDKLRAKIGYPENPQDYSNYAVNRDSFLTNVRNGDRFHKALDLAQIGKPVNHDKWYMSASTNNAYYDPPNNEIVFPAGILQTPYFDLDFDEAMNYGAIGATIGHELSHGFDDSGAQFDADGNLRNWFSDEDLARFQAKAGGIERQFSEYVVEGLPVDGQLVLGEALADLGGLEIAYAAYKKATEGKPPEMVDGFTPDQRFFLSFAQSWATNVRPEYAKLMVKTDPHPHPKLRVNGTVSNMPEFFDAFGVQPGDPMRRPEDKRNAIWR